MLKNDVKAIVPVKMDGFYKAIWSYKKVQHTQIMTQMCF